MSRAHPRRKPAIMEGPHTAPEDASMLRCLLLVLMLFLVWPVGLPAQCPECQGTGLRDCRGREHDSKKHCGTELPHRCDVILRASCCRGLLKAPCDRCQVPDALASLDKELEARRSWVKEMAKLDQVAGNRLVHVESTNFLLHFSIAGWKTTAARLNRVQSAHLFTERLEKTATRFQEVVGALPEKRQTLFLLSGSAENRKVTKTCLGLESEFALRLFGEEGKASLWPTPPFLITDEAFHSHVVHHATHLLVHGLAAPAGPPPVWLDIGLAHWLEKDLTGACFTFCEIPDQSPSEWSKGNWPGLVASDVRSRNEVPLASLAARDPKRLTHRDHVLAWSYTGFLVDQGPEKVLAVLRAGGDPGDAGPGIKMALGEDLETFQASWRKWALRPPSRR